MGWSHRAEIFRVTSALTVSSIVPNLDITYSAERFNFYGAGFPRGAQLTRIHGDGGQTVQASGEFVLSSMNIRCSVSRAWPPDIRDGTHYTARVTNPTGVFARLNNGYTHWEVRAYLWEVEGRTPSQLFCQGPSILGSGWFQ